jgi:hypothetical protein
MQLPTITFPRIFLSVKTRGFSLHIFGAISSLDTVKICVERITFSTYRNILTKLLPILTQKLVEFGDMLENESLKKFWREIASFDRGN